jgi:hypothetical protein
MPKIREFLSLRNRTTRRTLLIGLAFIAVFIILALIAIQGWEYTNSVAFCANTCHDVHPEEPAAFQDSYHARVKCTECHMGRIGTLRSIGIKVTHNRHLPEVLFHNYERPLESKTMRPANESCERCHWPPAFHGDTVREVVHFLPDETNTEKHIYLILKTGGGERDRGLGYGIHWHIENPVEYISRDEREEDIAWVRTTLPNGETVTYNDVVNPLTEDEIAQAEIHTMECVDCHNRVGHPFPPPDPAIDEAIKENRISRDVPWIKLELSNLLTVNYTDQPAALAAAGAFAETYAQKYPDIAPRYTDELEQAEAVAKDLLPRVIFEEPGVTWQSFPDRSGHKYFAGCFRCHDGNHLSETGESIRLHCNICHTVPVVTEAGDRPPQMPIASIQEPDSHLATNFMADHRFQASEACSTCHGPIEFGTDDSSFCANSACHGQSWPEVQLDAGFTHPIELVGRHADAWCHQCHEGVAKPEYVCSNCHEPPSQPHFGENCEDCHTPEGFKPANLSNFQHPVTLVGAHAEADCMSCHAAGLDLEYECANCHQPPPDHFAASCDTCHTPEGFAESAATVIQAAARVPHSLEDMQRCLECHGPDGVAPTIPDNHQDFKNNLCLLCHEGKP